MSRDLEADLFARALRKALKGMDGEPEPLLDAVNHRLRAAGESLTEAELVELVTVSDANDPARMVFHVELSIWDGETDPEWARDLGLEPTQAKSTDRRAQVLTALGFGQEAAAAINDALPPSIEQNVVIEGKNAQRWYTRERIGSRTFYWDHYRELLETKGLDADAIAGIDTATDDVVSRLSDPTRAEAYQSKGLVVGRVQSGKTANFTGVIAKAIDAGYRLVIVLTGTLELLRSQTQRRLDMELVGEENILGGIPRDDLELLRGVDYAGTGDRDWQAGKFVRYGQRPRDVGAPDIRRLTRSQNDYLKLGAGLDALDFRSGSELRDPAKPMWHGDNIFGTDVRIAVVKKNSNRLRQLTDDLKKIHADLGEIPTLIIDDEADQASPNTKKQKPTEEDRERTAINKRIATLLGILKRAQYVGYTATPFANVFVDPDDIEDIFPKDFIVSLEAPKAYMGGRVFHDLDLDPDDERTLENSGEKAFVRDLVAAPDDDEARMAEIRQALDAFVLSGAIKLWRQSRGVLVPVDHHTMLVHETVKQIDHSELANDVHDVWRSAGHSQPSGLRRLYDLWAEDYLPVSRARAGDLPIPDDFGELRPFIGRALDRIGSGNAPIAVVNGSKEGDYKQDDINFDTNDVWKILVGGAKLSRGFTVEGLTVSYYTRRTQAADTLMQMGRWFGYRPGYHDLVRLYVGRNVPGPRRTRVDLYEAFTAAVRDEEDFRDELRAFQGRDELGNPKVTPKQIPPLVFQSLPWLKPTATNKMYNAVLKEKGEGGKVKDFSQQPPHRDATNRRHFAAVEPVFRRLDNEGSFVSGTGGVYLALYGVVPAEELLAMVAAFEWPENGFDFGPTQAFIEKAMVEMTLEDWFVFVPRIRGEVLLPVRGSDLRVPVIERNRRSAARNHEFSGSSPRQRLAMEIVSGGVTREDLVAEATRTGGERSAKVLRALEQNPLALDLHTPTRGALLLTFAADDGRHPTGGPAALSSPVPAEHIASVFSLALPKLSAPRGRVGYTVLVSDDRAVVDRSEAREP